MFLKSLSISWCSSEPTLNAPFCKGGLRGIYEKEMQKNSLCPTLKKGRLSELIGISFILTLSLICGCGYRFSPGGEYIDKKIRTVFIDNFANRTGETYIDNTIRNAFINQFTTGSRFTIVDRREKADAIFRGSIDNITTAPLSYQKSNLAAEERVTITMELAFEEQDTKKSIWTNKSFSGYQDYATPDLNSKEANRKNALIKLSNDTAERAYRLMMSGF
jgi:hypothetical protein